MALFHTTVLDNQIKALDTIGSVSGAICTFDTDRTERLVKCVCEVASGASEINVVACGKNFVDYTDFTSGLPDTTIGADISIIIATTRYAYYGFKSPKGIVTISANSSDINYFDEYYVYGYANSELVYFSGFKTPADVLSIDTSSYDYIRVAVGARGGYNVPLDISSYGYVQLVKGNSTTFAPYNGTTFNIQFGETLSDTATYDAISGVLTRNDSTTKQLDSCNIVTLDNEPNNVYCDTGDTEVNYIMTVGKAIS